jgi:hypothetical protein
MIPWGKSLRLLTQWLKILQLSLNCGSMFRMRSSFTGKHVPISCRNNAKRRVGSRFAFSRNWRRADGGFIKLLTQLVIEAGIDRSHIYYQDSLDLPGYFRPNKKWWLVPIIAMLLMFGLLILLSSTGVAPFIYTLF